MQTKQKWNHTQKCDYCVAQEAAPDYHYENGKSGCKHYRGGKSASDRGHSWPKLKLGPVPTS